LLRGVKLPPQPGVMIELYRLLAKPDLDLRAIAQVIERDLSLAARVLKVVNSPLYGLGRTIDSIPRAVQLLGVRNLVHVVTAVSLRQAMENHSHPLTDRFFDLAHDIALIAAGLAERYGVMPADQAYTLGLFHDCGMLLMLQRFPDYGAFIEQTGVTTGEVLVELENARYDTNHAVVGYFLCRGWRLPDAVTEAVARHHRVRDVLAEHAAAKAAGHADDGLAARVALVSLADAIGARLRAGDALMEVGDALHDVLAFFDIGEQEFGFLCEEMRDLLAD
ncbi:MAG: HDOD domain-containing protein, partial [Chromatiales bacterium]|nr:HDOD domain-containing protein [Chromatiales bacterium]